MNKVVLTHMPMSCGYNGHLKNIYKGKQNLFPSGTFRSTLVPEPLAKGLSQSLMSLRSMCMSENCRVSELRKGWMATGSPQPHCVDDKAQNRRQECCLCHLLPKLTLSKQLVKAKKDLVWVPVLTRTKEQPESWTCEPVQVGRSLLPLFTPQSTPIWTVSPLPVTVLMGISSQHSLQDCTSVTISALCWMEKSTLKSSTKPALCLGKTLLPLRSLFRGSGWYRGKRVPPGVLHSGSSYRNRRYSHSTHCMCQALL